MRKHIFKDGSVYEGEGREDTGTLIRHGKGTFIFSNKDTYVGEWRDNKREGYGIWTCAATGDIYEGNWENDERNGKGIMNFGNGGKYEGDWKHNAMNGFSFFFIFGS